MFLPFFIAVLLGLVSPSNGNHTCNNTGTVNVSSQNDPGGTEDPGDPGDSGDTGDTGSDTGGEQGHIPPTKP